MRFETAVVRRLTEVGFLACGQGRFDEATTIFDALREARPQSEYPLIGLAVLELARNNADGAVAVLRRQALSAFPDSATVKAFLGFALFAQGHRQESRAILEPLVADATTGAEVLALARGVLESA